MNDNREKTRGRVCLVGAGPGDAGLITARGLALLHEADVVVHDALVLDALLREAREDADIIDVGKRHSDHKMEQDEINELLAEHAMAGKLVVRLKGGDPFVFGRGAEEAAYLGQRGVVCEVVPGVTAGVAAPGLAGIPVTHRLHSSMIAFVTGHEDEGKENPLADWPALASIVRAGGTLCIYMGMHRLAEIVALLRDAGLDADTPAAIVQWGATPRQQTLRSKLGELVEAREATGIWAPAIIVVGAVAAIDEPGLDAYMSRPLFNQRVVITRTRTQASMQRDKLAALGAEVLEAPTIRIDPPDADTQAKIDNALRHIERYDWLVLTSANGVDMLAATMDRLELDARHLAHLKVAAIGVATAAALRERLSIRADLVPRTYVAESLAAELIDAGVRDRRILLLRADIAREALPQLLADAGAHFDELPIYLNVPEPALRPRVLQAFRDGKVDWVTFTSSSTARNLVSLLGDERDLLSHAKIASIGPITSDTVRELGFDVTAEAEPSTIDGLIDAMVQWHAGRASEKVKT